MLGFASLGEMALAEAPEGPAAVAVYGIDYSLSLPVRTAPRALAGVQPHLAFDPLPRTIAIDWFAPLSEPKRFVRALSVSSQPSVGVSFDPIPFVSIDWHRPMSEPKRFAQALRVDSQPFDSVKYDPVPVVSFSWARPLSEPKRFAKGLRAADQPFDSVKFYPVPIIDVVLEWFRPLSEPKRFPKELRTAAQPSVGVAFDPVPVISIAWFVKLSLPRKLTPPSLPPGEQQVLEFDPVPIIAVDWHRPLSEPKRFVKRLQPANNPDHTRSGVPFWPPRGRGYVIT